MAFSWPGVEDHTNCAAVGNVEATPDTDTIPGEYVEDELRSRLTAIFFSLVGGQNQVAVTGCLFSHTFQSGRLWAMKRSWELTDEEKQNGKRAVLIPSVDIQAKMQPISLAGLAR